MLQSVIVTHDAVLLIIYQQKQKPHWKQRFHILTYRNEHPYFTQFEYFKFPQRPSQCQTWPGSEFTAKQLLSFFRPAEALCKLGAQCYRQSTLKHLMII